MMRSSWLGSTSANSVARSARYERAFEFAQQAQRGGLGLGLNGVQANIASTAEQPPRVGSRSGKRAAPLGVRRVPGSNKLLALPGRPADPFSAACGYKE